MIRAINERNARVRHLKVFAERQPAKAGTDHDDLRFFVSSHVTILKQPA
jgi:hypothetical protein